MGHGRAETLPIPGTQEVLAMSDMQESAGRSDPPPSDPNGSNGPIHPINFLLRRVEALEKRVFTLNDRLRKTTAKKTAHKRSRRSGRGF